MVQSTARAQGDHHLWWLGIRALWVLLVADRLADFVTLAPVYLASARRACENACQVTPQQARSLQGIGVSLVTYANVTMILLTLCVAVSTVIALLLFWRRSRDWMALLVAFFLVSFPINNLSALLPSGAPLGFVTTPALALALAIPQFAVSYGIFFLFPSGRLVPRWSWIAIVGWVIWHITALVVTNSLAGPLVLGYPLFYGLALGAQVYRYRVVSTPAERQQTKWVTAGLALALVTNQLFWLPLGISPLFTFAAFIVYLLSLLFVPITFFIALQRYRLWDIDVFINRTLVYLTLTAALAAIYLLGVVGVQHALNLVFGASANEYPPLIVLTTLLVAALFQPLRRVIQQVIDRRFYRTKYDAARTVAAFSAALRQDIDLEACQEKLLQAVEQTLQPELVSLWLREPPRQ